MNSSSDDELLLAVRYISGECDSTEILAFEERLAEDETAQSALVEATRIVALLKATPSCTPLLPTPLLTQTRPQRTRVRRPWSAVLAAGVVVGLGGLGLYELMNRPAELAQTELAQTQVASDVAHAWSALDEGSSEAAEIEDDLADTQDLAEEVPDWLLTAVMVQEEEAGHGDNANSEEQL